MSRTHDSYRAWGEYRKERSRLKDFTNWKHEAQGELEDMEDNITHVYIVMNSWTPTGSEELSEVVCGRYFLDEDEAWGHLSDIAEAHQITLDFDDTSFSTPPTAGIEEQTYYIEELTHGD